MHSKHIALIALAALAGPAAASIQAPEVGTVLEYACNGPYNQSIRNTITSVNGSVVRIDGTADDRKTWSERPLWALPTTYATTRSRGDDRGVRSAKIKKGSLEGLAAMRPGSSFKAQVRVEHDRGSPVWLYEVSVGDRRTTNDPVVGNVEVIEVTESRSTGNYSSTLVVRMVPALGLSLGWSYKDRRGEERCSLKAKS